MIDDEPKYSIIVAAFNEAETIGRCLREVLEVYPDDAEVVVVDGGNDNTREVVEQISLTNPLVRYICNENDRGKGHAIRRGVAESRASIMAQIDADLQFPPRDLPRLFVPILENRADVTLGTRFARGSTRLPGSTAWLRTRGNKLASLYASVLFLHRMTDVQAGMKAWTSDAIKQIDFLSDNYSYEAEIPIKALMKGLRVVDVPITTDARQGGQTNVNVVFDGLALLRDISLFRLGLK